MSALELAEQCAVYASAIVERDRTIETLASALRDVAEYLDLKAEGFAREYPPDHCINLTVNRQRENVREALRAAGVQP